jgi:hypothetical protein
MRKYGAKYTGNGIAGHSGTVNQVDHKETKLVWWSDGHCPGSVPSLSYTALMPLTAEALAAIGRALGKHT